MALRGVWKLQKLVVSHRDWEGSSRGVRNLAGGTSYLSTDQKKNLLWGNKKNTSTEEQSGSHWDLQLFADRERQEKFNKLMSLRLPWYLWPGQLSGVKGDDIPEREPSEMDAEKKQKLEMDLEKQHAAGLH